MEIFMWDISSSSNKHQINRTIASVLHTDGYTGFSSRPINFHVQLFRNKSGRNHRRQGCLTLPTLDVGDKFLQEYGGSSPLKSLWVGNRRIKFKKSNRNVRSDVVEAILRLPYVDPREVEEREQRTSQLQSESVSIRTVQFGWECRDSVYSIEWEGHYDSCSLVFDNERRELRIKIFRPSDTLVVAIRFSYVLFSSACISSTHQPTIVFSLHTHPSYEVDMTDHEAEQLRNSPFFKGNIYDHKPRQRLSALDADHASFAPYTSLAIRLICNSELDISLFRRQAKLAGFHDPLDFDYPAEYRGLFSYEVQDELHRWLHCLPWGVAFQVESLVRSLTVDMKEMLNLQADVTELIDTKGDAYASAMLRHFLASVKALCQTGKDSQEPPETVEQCFHRSKQEYQLLSRYSPSLKPVDSVDCLHVFVTPSSQLLEGPFPEQSNRVLRRYSDHHENFLRVSFVDEARLQYRFDREIDGRSFIRHRVRTRLLEGITVAGRTFEFLAYSQSALKEHAVWFFGCVRRLIYCPARYGARIAQAFTATDASVSVEAEEIFYLDDVQHNEWCFTDGVGTISLEMADDIYEKLHSSRRRRDRYKARPRAYQVRFMGSKGMLSVDYKLSGRVICLRPSMIKFKAPHSREIEIARSFDRPGQYYLNRPLIMILEGVGVPYKTFKDYQDDAVAEAHESTESMPRAARFLENHGLGSSFRLTSVMLSLDILGVAVPNNLFYEQMMEVAVHHVLRELKQHARIPVPGGWTLVGVADVHNYLAEGQIFACVKPVGSRALYLQGPVLISRSPTIHPGDVQVAHAIGKPPEGCCFHREPLPNTVVFSVRGERPLPSCLGGGDLDGDVYNLIPWDDIPSFFPDRSELAVPAAYKAAPKKFLDRPCNMGDVADFVCEYITSDVLGIIAINWMIIADQSPQGIHDPDCIRLAELHSDAVDYPKSGQPVSIATIPRLKFREKPDWNAPETVTAGSAEFYKSHRAIGKLFRAINLPALPSTTTRRHHQIIEEDEEILEEQFAHLDLDHADQDPVYDAVEARVSQFIFTEVNNTGMTDYASHMFSRYTSELRSICATHTLSFSKSALLSEEEAVIGTIVAKSSQPRKRKDLMSKLREQTDLLVRGIREDLAGDEDSLLDEWLQRAWVAWRHSIIHQKQFGSQSFGWVALGSIFEAIKAIEGEKLKLYA